MSAPGRWPTLLASMVVLAVALLPACRRGSAPPPSAPITPAATPAPRPAALPEAEIDPAVADAPLELPARKDTPPALLRPWEMQKRAPDHFRVRFETSRGPFVVEVTRAWAPRGADRFYNLVTSQFYRGVRVHRVIPGQIVQFGIHGDPAVNRAFYPATIPDDPRRFANRRGLVSLAGVGKDQRRTELIVNLSANPALDEAGLAPIGRIAEGIKVVDRLPAPNPAGVPSPAKRYILTIGEPYLAAYFPRTARITSAAFCR